LCTKDRLFSMNKKKNSLIFISFLFSFFFHFFFPIFFILLLLLLALVPPREREASLSSLATMQKEVTGSEFVSLLGDYVRKNEPALVSGRIKFTVSPQKYLSACLPACFIWKIVVICVPFYWNLGWIWIWWKRGPNHVPSSFLYPVCDTWTPSSQSTMMDSWVLWMISSGRPLRSLETIWSCSTSSFKKWSFWRSIHLEGQPSFSFSSTVNLRNWLSSSW